MNYTLTPSLKHIALVKISTTLWNQDDIRAIVDKFRFPLFDSGKEKRQEIEDKVIEKVPQLSQPVSLKENILSFIKPIGLQIFKWIEYHKDLCSLGIHLPNELCWTPQGTVDNKKTAKALIKGKSLDIIARYILACIYCLEDDILELWNKIPEKCSRKPLYTGIIPSNNLQQEQVSHWTCEINGFLAKMDNRDGRICPHNCSAYEYAFEYAAVGGNKAAAEYFLQKLTSKEREVSLVRTTGYVANRHCDYAENRSGLFKGHYADVLCFLLSQMDEEQQIEVFKRYPYKVLKCLLEWPWQRLFMETANRMWDFLSAEDYDRLLEKIIKKVKNGYKDYNYQKLFGEFWQQIPNAHKRYVINECASGFLLSELFKIKNEENIKLILKDATLIEKKKLIFCDRGQDICQDLIYDDKWNLLKFFVQECISSKDIMVKFKEEFKELVICRRSEEKLEREKDKWSKFFQLLDDLIQKDDKKRSIEEGNSSPAKRLHSIEFEE